MALVKCKECGKEISDKAESCPHCGAPQKKKSTQYGCGTLIFFGIIVLVLAGMFSSKDPSTTPSPPEVSDADCKKTLQCWGDRQSIAAGVRCQGYVEKLAKYSYKWTDGILEPKFSHFRWKNQSTGVVTFIGDKIQFQNGFGAFQNYIYECDFDPSSEQVLHVRARPGRL